MIGVPFAGEKYCFDCMHKYKIGDKKNDTYEFEFDLQTTIFVNNRNSIGRIQTKDLSKLVENRTPIFYKNLILIIIRQISPIAHTAVLK